MSLGCVSWMVSPLSEATEGLGTSGNQDIIEKLGPEWDKIFCLSLFIQGEGRTN